MAGKRNGVREWIFQRISNVVIIAFAIFYLAMLASNGAYTYDAWVATHSAMWFKVLASVALVFVAGNSILAGWQIGTDYTQKVPVAGFAPIFHGFYIIVSIACLLFGMRLLWM